VKGPAASLSTSILRVKPTLDHGVKQSSPSQFQYKSRKQNPALCNQACPIFGGMPINSRSAPDMMKLLPTTLMLSHCLLGFRQIALSSVLVWKW